MRRRKCIRCGAEHDTNEFPFFTGSRIYSLQCHECFAKHGMQLIDRRETTHDPSRLVPSLIYVFEQIDNMRAS